jgi:hypothetical protein
MLTDNQRKTFQDIQEGKLNPKQKGDFYYRMSKILKEELEGLDDASRLLDELPESYLEKIDFEKIAVFATGLTEKLIEKRSPSQAIPAMLDLIESILLQLDPWPIGEHEEGGSWAFKIYGNTASECPTIEPGKCIIFSISRNASDDEIELHRRLKDHFNLVRRFVDPCIPDPVCRDPKYIEEQRNKALEITKEISKNLATFGVHCNTYLDEFIGKNGWMEPKHSMVGIDELKSIRWMPRGLKGCMEQPPLLEPRKIRGRLIDSVTISSDDELYIDHLGPEKNLTFEDIRIMKYGPKYKDKESASPNRGSEVPRDEPKSKTEEGPK